MPPRGRPPVPVEIRNAQGGTPGKGAVSHRPAKSPVVLGQRVVSKDMIKPMFRLGPIGQEMWDDIVMVFIGYGVVTTVDAPNMTMMCHYWEQYVAAVQALKEQGRYDFGSTGQARRSPLVADMKEMGDKYLKIAEQYGGTAAARTRLALMDVSTRSIESDLATRLGSNPRKTNRAIGTAKRQIEKE